MYLSRIRLNTKKRSTMIALSNPQKIHGAIESSFSERCGRTLWRIDELRGEIYLLVLSEASPDLSNVVAQFGHDNEPFKTRTYDKLLERISNGSRWQFRLTANPTICHKNPGDNVKRGKITAYISPEYQEKWLFDRAEANGFELSYNEFQVSGNRPLVFKKHGKRCVTLLSVTYDGILTVTDADKFKKAMISGIGRGKAYGNGLLTIVHI